MQGETDLRVICESLLDLCVGSVDNSTVILIQFKGGAEIVEEQSSGVAAVEEQSSGVAAIGESSEIVQESSSVAAVGERTSSDNKRCF
jgi:hypothetical protein